MARVKVLLKLKNNIQNTNVLEYSDLKLDICTGKICVNDTEIVINGKELDLLEILLVNKNQIVNREMLVNKIWGYNSIVSTLTDNAIKHTKAQREIEVELKKEKNEIILEVKNIGDPIPEEEREKIFDRFYRIDKSRNRNEKRYGLGLAIAKSTIEKYNGKVEVFYKDNFTVFRVTISN